MKEFNLLKNTLKCSALFSNLSNCISMENIENNIITLKKIDTCNKETVINFVNKEFDNIMINIKQEKINDFIESNYFKDFVNKNKNDIISLINLGNKSREDIFSLSEKFYKFIDNNFEYNNIKKDIVPYRNLLLKKNLNEEDKKLLKQYENNFKDLISNFKEQNKNNEFLKKYPNFDYAKLLCIDIKKNYNEQINIIGRKVLHKITEDMYTQKGDEKLKFKDKFFTEIRRLYNGEINCTCNAFMLFMFLKLHGIMCDLYEREDHEFVLIKCKNLEKQRIDFYTINLVEKGTIDEMKFKYTDLITYGKKNMIWDWINKKDFKIFFLTKHTPLYLYYKSLIDSMNSAINENYDIEIVKYYLNGLKYATNCLIEKKYFNGSDEWLVGFLPRLSDEYTVIFNLDDLGEPKIVELEKKINKKTENYKKILFKSKKNDKLIDIETTTFKIECECERNDNYDGCLICDSYYNNESRKNCKIKTYNIDYTKQKYLFYFITNDNQNFKYESNIDGIIKDKIIKVYK